MKPKAHPMWNAIHDDKGRERGSFFAKNVFYDREAFLSPPTTRYSAVRDYDACGDDLDEHHDGWRDFTKRWD